MTDGQKEALIAEWYKQGQPEIPLGPGVTLTDLERYLDDLPYQPDSPLLRIDQEILLAKVRDYLGVSHVNAK